MSPTIFRLSGAAFLVCYAAALGTPACGSSDSDTGENAAPGASNGQGGSAAINPSCNCEITNNGVQKTLSCGESACINDEAFACDSGANVVDKGECPKGQAGSPGAGGTTGSAGAPATDGTTGMGGAVAAGGMTGGGGGTANVTEGLEITIDGTSVAFTDVVGTNSSGAGSGGYIRAESASNSAYTQLSILVPSLKSGTYPCIDPLQPSNKATVFLTLASGAKLQSSNNDGCQVTITSTCSADGFVHGTIGNMTVYGDGIESSQTIPLANGQFVAKCQIL
jgi:hypothetical protein